MFSHISDLKYSTYAFVIENTCDTEPGVDFSSTFSGLARFWHYVTLA